MTAIELDARKATVIRDIQDNVNTAELLDQLSDFVKRLVRKDPCRYDMAEMDAILDEGEHAMDNDEGIASEEVFSGLERKYPFLCK